MKKEINISQNIILICLIALAVSPLFANLNFLPIRLFDESRLAVNALEMSRDFNFLVTHYKGEPDTWNLKPPLLIWCQTLCIYFFGAGETALRIPSAISGLLTILFTFFFVKLASGKVLWGFAVALVLLATPGYITEHGTRSGDYDALLVLFQLLYAGSYFLFLKNMVERKYWYITCIGVILAVYTKGIAGFMLLPGLLIFTIVSGKLTEVIRLKVFWYGIIAIILIIAAYYGLREIYQPEYLKRVYDHEIFYRYFDVNEGHEGKWNFYVMHIVNSGYSYWYLFALAGVLMMFLVKDIATRNVLLFTTIITLSFLCVISYSETKIEWYVLPLYPFMAILSGAFFWFGFNLFANKMQKHYHIFKLGVVLLFSITFVFNYVLVLKKVMYPAEIKGEENIYRLSYILQGALKGKENLDGIYYCYPSYNAHLHFYTEVLKSKGQQITLIDQKQLKTGFKVLVGSTEVIEFIKSNHQTEIVKSWENGGQLLLVR